MADVMCAICMAPLHDEIEPDVTALECGHAFHTYCLQTYLTASAHGTMMELPRLNCKMTGISMSEQRSQAQRDSLIPGEPASCTQVSAEPPSGEPASWNSQPGRHQALSMDDDPVPQTPTPPNAQTCDLERELDAIFTSPTFADALLTADEAARIDQDLVCRSQPDDLVLPKRAREIASAHASVSPALSLALYVGNCVCAVSNDRRRSLQSPPAR